MSSNTDARRENARRNDGKFGEQSLDPSDKPLAPVKTPREMRVAAFRWLHDRLEKTPWQYRRTDASTVSDSGRGERVALETILYAMKEEEATPDKARDRIDVEMENRWNNRPQGINVDEFNAGMAAVRDDFDAFCTANDLHSPEV